jgi:hypothetical protein
MMQVMLSGKKVVSQSIPLNATSVAMNPHQIKTTGTGPSRQATAENNTPVRISTKG